METKMKNEEKAEQIAWNLFDDGLFFHNHESQRQEIQSAILQMAKWKDEQFARVLDETYEMRKEICRSNVSFADLTEFVQQLRKKINKEE